MNLLVLTESAEPTAVLPALALLEHPVSRAAPELATLMESDAHDVVLVDARGRAAEGGRLCALLNTVGVSAPLVTVLRPEDMAAVSGSWGTADFILVGSGPAEVDARLRLARLRTTPSRTTIELGDLVIDEEAYSATVNGAALDLTFLEFSLLVYLARHPGRVFSRVDLVSAIWDAEFQGSLRTVDVHVRRLRAKLGPQHAAMICTVRNIGYRLSLPQPAPEPEPEPESARAPATMLTGRIPRHGFDASVRQPA